MEATHVRTQGSIPEDISRDPTTHAHIQVKEKASFKKS